MSALSTLTRIYNDPHETMLVLLQLVGMLPRPRTLSVVSGTASPHRPSLAQPRPPSEAHIQGVHTAVGMGRNGGSGEEQHLQIHPKSTPKMQKRLLLPASSTARPMKHAG